MSQLIAKEGLPIKGDPTKFDRLVDRHGQHVLWYQGSPCTCLGFSGAADPECSSCRGLGTKYILASEIPTSGVGRGLGVDWIDPSPFNITDIGQITDAHYGKQIPLTPISLDLAEGRLTFEEVIPKHSRVFLEYKRQLESQYLGEVSKIKDGVYDVPIDKVTAEGAFTGALKTITTLQYYLAADPETKTPMNVLSFYKDQVYTDTEVPVDAIVEINCTYVAPIIVSIVSVNAVKPLSNNINGDPLSSEVDAWMTFPQAYPISHTDLIATMSAELRESVVSQDKDHVKLPSFDVARILRVADANGEIEGAVIQQDNTINWTGREPVGPYTVTYMYNPVFSIVDKETNLRNYEDKRYPKRVGIKRFIYANINLDQPTADPPVKDKAEDEYYV